MPLDVRVISHQKFEEFKNPWDDRNGFTKAFRTLVQQESGLKGRVLDIGCGKGISNEAMTDFPSWCAHLDGIDPTAEVMEHPALENRWQGEFETAPIPEQTYDLAIAFNVVEHIKNSRSFIDRVAAILKPGGVFWALTPHADHPFCWISRGVELVGLKNFAADKHKGINRYSTYYRLNSIGGVRKLAEHAGFARADFYRFPCVNWDSYFPQYLHWAPHLYDHLLGCRVPAFMQIIVYRLQKA
ncbi:MAG TPA: class I SAM-dependent methyltransferase [Phycisphaerae bacterium]|nr:class I SAM-dependent methyltransferase [Phycisphaerae bacterium]